MPNLTLSSQEKRQILEDALAWLVVMAMLLYGVGKSLQFKGAADIDTPVSELTGMQLMWAFYGYSRPFSLFLGILEISGAFMLLYRPFRLFGALFLSTVLVNIIVQDLAFDVNRGALKAAIIYQVALLLICWLHRQQFAKAFKALRLPRGYKGISFPRLAIRIGLAFGLFVLLRVGEYYLTH
ncbi:MAG: hypothetical protein AAFV07_00265 [Bacteroidota bacterium]